MKSSQSLDYLVYCLHTSRFRNTTNVHCTSDIFYSTYIYLHHTPTQSPYCRDLVFQRRHPKLSHQLMCWIVLDLFDSTRFCWFFSAQRPVARTTVKCIPVTPRNDPLTSRGHWTTPTSFHGLAKHRPFGHHFWGGSKCESVFGGKNGKTSVI